jgi:hypothetical protein
MFQVQKKQMYIMIIYAWGRDTAFKRKIKKKKRAKTKADIVRELVPASHHPTNIFAIHAKSCHLFALP